MGFSLGDHDHDGPDSFEMIVDRPFLLAVTDSETDLILFVGVIGDPTPSE